MQIGDRVVPIEHLPTGGRREYVETEVIYTNPTSLVLCWPQNRNKKMTFRRDETGAWVQLVTTRKGRKARSNTFTFTRKDRL